jgi:hypothetical protein
MGGSAMEISWKWKFAPTPVPPTAAPEIKSLFPMIIYQKRRMCCEINELRKKRAA